MSAILNALQVDNSRCRVNYDAKWLVWEDGGWVVYYRPYRKHTSVATPCDSEAEAVELLLDENFPPRS